jgi:hypothetical protein
MEQSPSREPNLFSASQEMSLILFNPNILCRIHKCPPPVPILSQLIPVHNSTSNFLKIHVNIILSSTPGSSKWTLSLRLPHQTHIHASPPSHTHYMLCSFHSFGFYHSHNSGWRVHIMKLLIMWFSPVPCYLAPLGSNILLNTLISNALSLRYQPSFTPIKYLFKKII